jgi:non-heme chloroperoxidase
MMFMASHGFRCVAFDHHGHGWSSQPWKGNNYDTFSKDLSELIGTLYLKAATLVRHSVGPETSRAILGGTGRRVFPEPCLSLPTHP